MSISPSRFRLPEGDVPLDEIYVVGVFGVLRTLVRVSAKAPEVSYHHEERSSGNGHPAAQHYFSMTTTGTAGLMGVTLDRADYVGDQSAKNESCGRHAADSHMEPDADRPARSPRSL